MTIPNDDNVIVVFLADIMRAFIALLLVAVASAELAPLFKNSEPIKGKYIVKLRVSSQSVKVFC